MKEIKYPGKAIKISWWQRLVNWYWNWRYPMIFHVKDLIDSNPVVDQIYNQMIDNQKRILMPPFNIKK